MTAVTRPGEVSHSGERGGFHYVWDENGDEKALVCAGCGGKPTVPFVEWFCWGIGEVIAICSHCIRRESGGIMADIKRVRDCHIARHESIRMETASEARQ